MIDAAVVGGGPNGLAGAVVMARAGRSVVLYERSSTIGGASSTRELTLPGFRHDLGAAVHPLGSASPLFRSLSLGRYGLTWLRPEVPLAHPLDGGRAAAIYHSITVTAEHLGGDGPRYQRVIGGFARRWDDLESAVFGPVLRIPDRPVALAGLGFRGLLPASTAARQFRTEEGRALLAGLAAHVPMPLDKPGNTAVALVLAALAHVTGWPVARGGSQSISDALGTVLADLGGSIETDHAVESLDDLPPAHTVLLNIGPRDAAAIFGDRISGRIRRAFRGYRHGPGSFKVDFALAGPVPWTAEACRKAGTLHLGGTFEEIAHAEQEVWDARVPERPFVIAAQPSVIDPGRAPENKHVLWAYCHAPFGSTLDMTGAIERQIERFAPGFRDLILARRSMGPAELEAWNPNLVGGDIAGGRTDRLRMLVRPRLALNPYRIGPGLYLCSSATPPGPGVHGMSGYHAARAALRDSSG